MQSKEQPPKSRPIVVIEDDVQVPPPNVPPPTVRVDTPRPYAAVGGKKGLGAMAGMMAAMVLGLLDTKNGAVNARIAQIPSGPAAPPKRKRLSGCARRRALRASRKRMQNASRRINRGTPGRTKRKGQQ